MLYINLVSTFCFRIVLFDVNDVHQRLDQIVHVSAALDRIFHEIQSLVDAKRIPGIDLQPLFGGEVFVLLHQFV